MARLSKRKRKTPVVVEQPRKPFTKKHELFLLGFILLNIVILAVGFQTMDAASLVMYALLVLSLVSVYIKKKFPLPGNIERYIDIFCTGAICLAFLLFIYVSYKTLTS